MRKVPPFKLDDPKSYVVDMTRWGNWLAYSTVRLDIDKGSGAGTAFFFSSSNRGRERSDFLVTNKHVVEDASVVSAVFHIDPPNNRNYFKPGGTAELDIENPGREFLPHPDPNVDLCAVPVDRCKELAGGRLHSMFYAPVGSRGLLTDDDYRRLYGVLRVVMVGYPIGLWDVINNLPIVRIGHTATHPAVSFQREPFSLIDIAVFPGSSGSPVLFWEDSYFGSVPKFLGVLFAGCQYKAGAGLVKEPIPTTASGPGSGGWINLGCVIRSRELEFLERV